MGGDPGGGSGHAALRPGGPDAAVRHRRRAARGPDLSGRYLDASAFVKLILPERGSAELAAEVRPEHVRVASALLEVEVLLAVARRRGDVAMARARLAGVRLIPVDATIRRRAAGLAGLRTLEAIHLATALEAPGLDAFYCYDARLGAVARRAGLPVRSPGYPAGDGEDD